MESAVLHEYINHFLKEREKQFLSKLESKLRKDYCKMERPEKRKLNKNSPYLEYDKGFNHACMLYEEFIKHCMDFKKHNYGKEKNHE